MSKTLTHLNYKVLEVARIEQIMYEDGNYHLNLNLLIDVEGFETVCRLSGSVDQFMDIIDPNEVVLIMTEHGLCTGQTTFGMIMQIHYQDIADYLVEGNTPEDLAYQVIEKMDRKELANIRRQIQADSEHQD